MAEKNIVLVHGAWHTADCWTPLIKYFPPHSSIVTPNLLPKNFPIEQFNNIHLSTYVERLKNELEKLDDNIMLVGHSFAGFVITAVAAKIPHKISQIIYLNAYIPLNHESLFSLSAKLKSNYLNPYLIINEQQKSITISPISVIKQYLYNQSSTIKELRPEPLQPFQDQIEINESFHTIPKYAIIAQNDLTLLPIDQLTMCQRLDVPYAMMNSDHCPFSSSPKELVNLLLNLRKSNV